MKLKIEIFEDTKEAKKSFLRLYGEGYEMNMSQMKARNESIEIFYIGKLKSYANIAGLQPDEINFNYSPTADEVFWSQRRLFAKEGKLTFPGSILRRQGTNHDSD